MARTTRRRRGVILLGALAAITAVPGSALGFGRPTLPLGDLAAPAAINRWSLDWTVDQHPADRPMVLRSGQPMWRLEARVNALATIAERAAAEAAARARAQADAAAKADAAARAAAAPHYAGTNHLWIPSLGVSRSVEAYACSRATPPANRVYRWGCAGANNVYLFGHAWGVFKAVHDAYVNGKIGKGFRVLYAGADGHVQVFRLAAIKVVTPDDIGWAIAAQDTLSVTLQTCLGARNEHRLLIRLVLDPGASAG